MEPSWQPFTASPMYRPDGRIFLSFQFLWKCISERCHVSIFSFLLVLRTHQVQRMYNRPTPPLSSPHLRWSPRVCEAVIHPLAWTVSPELSTTPLPGFKYMDYLLQNLLTPFPLLCPPWTQALVYCHISSPTVSPGGCHLGTGYRIYTHAVIWAPTFQIAHTAP